MGSIRSRVHAVVFGSDTFAGQVFDAVCCIIISASVSLTMLESVHAYRVAHASFFWDAERTFTALFTAEYVLRVLVAHPGPLAYVCSFFGVVDLCATMPSLLEIILNLGGSQRSIRIELVLRLLRVFRVLQWAGLNAEADALRTALWRARRKVAVFVLAIMVLVTLMGTVVWEYRPHPEPSPSPKPRHRSSGVTTRHRPSSTHTPRPGTSSRTLAAASPQSRAPFTGRSLQ